jgi:hypothetical protein
LDPALEEAGAYDMAGGAQIYPWGIISLNLRAPPTIDKVLDKAAMDYSVYPPRIRGLEENAKNHHRATFIERAWFYVHC